MNYQQKHVRPAPLDETEEERLRRLQRERSARFLDLAKRSGRESFLSIDQLFQQSPIQQTLLLGLPIDVAFDEERANPIPGPFAAIGENARRRVDDSVAASINQTSRRGPRGRSR